MFSRKFKEQIVAKYWGGAEAPPAPPVPTGLLNVLKSKLAFAKLDSFQSTRIEGLRQSKIVSWIWEPVKYFATVYSNGSFLNYHNCFFVLRRGMNFNEIRSMK